MKPLSERGRSPMRIGLTPLIDMVFILLVFFMLASNFHDWRAIPVASGGSGAGGGMRGALLVEVTPRGARLAGEALPLSELAAKLAARREENAGVPILIRPRGGVETGALVAVLDRLTAEGLADLTLVGGGP